MISGSFDRTTVPEVFRHLSAKSATGRLRASSRGERRTIYFFTGRPVYAVSSAIHERLGEVLVKSGRLSEQNLREALGHTTFTKKLGTVLVEKSYIVPHDLVWGLKLQVREIILALFTLDSGTFRFEECDIEGDDIVKLNLKLEALISEGVKRMTDEKVLLRSLGTMNGVLEVSRAPKPEVSLALAGDEKGLLESLRGGKFTVGEICRRSALPFTDTCRFLVTLLGFGVATRILPD